MTTVISSRLAALVAGAGILLGLAGCSEGGGRANVSGKITLFGKEPKLSGLQVIFLGKDGTSVSAWIDEDGSYQAADVAAGEVKVYFAATTQEQYELGTATKNGPRLKKPGSAATPPPPKSEKTGNYPKTNPLPPLLCDPLSSPVTTQVQTGRLNTFDYDIKRP